MEVDEVIFNKKDKTYSNVVKETKVNFSHNFVKAPEHYLDYDRFLDYQNILKPEYLDLIPDDDNS